LRNRSIASGASTRKGQLAVLPGYQSSRVFVENLGFPEKMVGSGAPGGL